LRILTLDIETRPHLAHVWALWDQNIGLSQLVEAGTVICFAAKWHGQPKVEFYSDHHDGHDVMVRKAWELVDKADAIVTYNGRAFDLKHLGREWLLAGLTPPASHRDIDLLTVARGRFKFASNKLDYVTRELGLGGKVKHDGFDLWVRCMADDPKAWSMMKRYCVGDVKLTEQVYDRFLPWINNHPNRALFDPDVKGGCPRCGSMEYQMRGTLPKQTGVYRRYRCSQCGGYWLGTHAVERVHTRSA
jgi:DNA polymerase elongation subunit (family B)